MRKCHYIRDGRRKVLIPECWEVVRSGDIEACTCISEPVTFAGFENKRYREVLERHQAYIAELEKEVEWLKNQIDYQKIYKCKNQ